MGEKYKDQLDVIEEKTKQGVEVFILTRADVTNKKIILDLLEINKKGYKGKIEIRYSFQPLRCTLIDDKVFYLKEGFSKYSEDDNDAGWSWTKGEYIYTITDKDWIDWMTNVFWHIWRGSIDVKQRLEILDHIIERQ